MPAQQTAARAYDIVVMGATGYSGKRVCKHLADAAEGYTWAIAGRDINKLTALTKDLKLPPTVGVLIADTTDKAALDSVCQQANVLVACAGPFDLIGMPVVEACVKNGTHYCDITGEFQFIRKMIEAYGNVAEDKKIMLVPCCGFDCVPSDMGNWLVHETVKNMNNGDPTVTVDTVKAYFAGAGAPSGGTMASIANLFKSIERKDLYPNSLTPRGAPRVPTPSTRWVGYCHALAKYQGPYIMAGINERVVRRSNALAGHLSSYVEAAVGSLSQVLAGAVGIYMLGILMSIPFIRALFCKFVFPAPGTGPSDEALAKGFFKGTFIGTTSRNQTVEVVVKDSRDGYTATGVFAASCALVAADMVRAKNIKSGGVLTASTAFGSALYERLRNAGVSFSVSLPGEGDAVSGGEKKRK